MTWRLSNTKYAGIRTLNLVFRQVPDHKDKDIYKCVCCSNDLLPPKPNLILGAGCFSFLTPINEISLKEEIDKSYSMIRTMVMC